MRLLFVRHGDPDYEQDTLTERGRIEAQLLSDRLVKTDAAGFFQSPKGRARATAAYTLEKTGREAVTLEWLAEFNRVKIRCLGQG